MRLYICIFSFALLVILLVRFCSLLFSAFLAVFLAAHSWYRFCSIHNYLIYFVAFLKVYKGFDILSLCLLEKFMSYKVCCQ